VLPATRFQGAAGAALFGPASPPVDVTLACSGTDALALCLGAILAYPARWRSRAAGVAGGAALILALNTIRIGTLGRAAASPQWFEALHIYVWPAALSVAIAAFVFTWMRLVDGWRPPRVRTGADPDGVEPSSGTVSSYAFLTLRFGLTAAALLLIFALASPLYLESPRVLALAGLVARAAAFLLRGLGVDATAASTVLLTPHGSFVVTQECISTPLIPVYFAAVLVHSRTWRSAALWSAASGPLFIALGIARLLAVAVPAGVDPAFFVHAFSQLLVGAAMVCGLALWRHGMRPATLVRAVVALALAFTFVWWLGAPYTRVIFGLSTAPPAFDDPQGALMFLPAFQSGLFLALWIAGFVPSGWRRFLGGAVLLAAVQVAVATGIQLLASHAGLAPLVRDVRAWALAGPALIIAAVVNLAPTRR
jgi:exosortase/archaeosortase family protein